MTVTEMARTAPKKGRWISEWHPDDPTRWLAKTLREVQPYYWARVFGKG